MSTAMQSKGRVFLGNTKPQAGKASNGTFELTMRVLDRHGHLKTAAWLLIWSGPEAQAWYSQHADALVSGAVLEVTCSHIRGYVAGRIAEVHAHVQECRLIPKTVPHYAAETA